MAIQSNLPELMRQPEILGLPVERTSHFISLYWGGLMIGRWAAAVTVFNLKGTARNVATVVVPLLAYGVVLADDTRHLLDNLVDDRVSHGLGRTRVREQSDVTRRNLLVVSRNPEGYAIRWRVGVEEGVCRDRSIMPQHRLL